MFETFMLSVAAFIGTNIDDLIINTFFFSLVSGKKEIRGIVSGKYIGIGILMLISFIGSVGAKCIPVEYVRYLGFIPIGLGVKEIIFGVTEYENVDLCMGDFNTANLLWNVAIITIANGADNIGIYIPLFAGFSLNQLGVFFFVVMFMTAIWSALGYKVSRVSFYNSIINKHKKNIVPLTYILLGVYILI